MAEPLELSVRFEAENDAAPLLVSLFRPDNGASSPPHPFTPPLDDAQLAELRWYLEAYSSWPTGPDYQRAERLENSMEAWGRALRDSIIARPDELRLWQQFLDASAEARLLTLDATDPRVLRLPWELLADEGGHLFARGIGVRRRLQQATTVPTHPFELPVRVLVVVSRPDDADFIDPRAVSRPLLDALDELGGHVATEFLYPPTLSALARRLRGPHAPPVHIVHFDGHGLYDPVQGLGYLLFEDAAHHSDRVDADRLGNLLHGCGVPLMVLNACQSASQQETNPYTSVAARLVRAGVGSVLAMSYSVTVAAARLFVGAFYGGLVAGASVGRAADEGRAALLADTVRHTLVRRNEQGEQIEEPLHLRDWFLPALYQQRAADPVIFVPGAAAMPGRTRPRALDDPGTPGGLPAAPLHCFHGRGADLLRLERALAERAVVVLHGFGGLGKTALAAEAGRWLYRTGRFPGGAAFVSFEGGGSLQALCSWVGQAVSGDPNFSLGEGDPVERVAALLRERPALVILDNFESVLGPEPLMPAEELAAVLDAVYRWATVGRPPSPAQDAGRGSRVLITTREASIPNPRFGPSADCLHLELGGLDGDEALELAAAVLDDCGLGRARFDRDELLALLERLGGHPLSLCLVLPALRRYTLADLTARFEELLPGFTAGAARERNESLALSLEFSLRRLGEATRAALPDLAVFQGGAYEHLLMEVTGITPEAWQAIRAELLGAALATLDSGVTMTVHHEATSSNYTSAFVRFHPTLLPHLASRLGAERRAALEERYWQCYYVLASTLYNLDDRHPKGARAVALRELPNLRRALDLAIASGQVGPTADFADKVGKFLDNFGRRRERGALVERISRLCGSSEEGVTHAEYLIQSQRGEALLAQDRVAEAEGVFRALLQRLEGADYERLAYDHAVTLVWLSRCLAGQGQPAQALDWLGRALREFEGLGGSDIDARYMVGVVHTDLGDQYSDLGRYDEAKGEYHAALEIAGETDDARGRMGILAQLGTLALRHSDLDQARHLYTEARAAFHVLEEPRSEAVAWHQLGRVAEEAGEWEEAERCYREAVRIREQIEDLPGLAMSYNQLGLVGQRAGRLQEAEQWYLQAQRLKNQLSPHDGSTLGNLAILCLSQGRLDEAERYAFRALEIMETLDLSAKPWKIYGTLADVAGAKGQGGETVCWRRKEQDSYAAYAGAAHKMRQHRPLVEKVVAACRGSEEAGRWVEGEYPKMEAAGGGWTQTAAMIRRILAGERDIEALRAEIDHTGYLIVRTILARLAEPPQDGSGSREA